jgi:2-phosphosulpholactate phosphatase
VTAPLIDVAFTPSEARRAEMAVVVDVLRAGSTIVSALEGGFRRVLCCDTVERAEWLRAPGRLLAGERGCRRIPGFDHGNSPAGLGGGAGAELVLCTTNGAPAIMAATGSADEVLVGSLLNLDAIIEALPPSVEMTVVCAGTNGRFALEDTTSPAGSSRGSRASGPTPRARPSASPPRTPVRSSPSARAPTRGCCARRVKQPTSSSAHASGWCRPCRG